MRESSPLPPGQVEVDDFPRFGLANFAFRFPTETERIEIAVAGDVEHPTRFAAELGSLERVEQVSDLHCVTTWTRRGLRWGGWRFCDFYEQLVGPHVRPEAGATLVVLRAQDGLAQSLPLEDALAPDVLLADHLDGERLGVDHGAPIRLIAPAHYGCKSVRHLNAVEFWRDARNYRFPGPRLLMNHPRARVMYEERGRVFPAWLFRMVWPAMIPPVRWLFAAGLRRHQRGSSVASGEDHDPTL
jgi:DMSO/TMAO reductase YedYZ molybdopterin-dependent catalytic subunit